MFISKFQINIPLQLHEATVIKILKNKTEKGVQGRNKNPVLNQKEFAELDSCLAQL